MRKIELLAPARNAEIGKEAIRHGADAVYIGGPGYGARSVASNSIEDIASLCEFAHIFGAKVYVTLNTILYDNELYEVERLVRQLYEVGVDALITQDIALLNLDLPSIPLHASTQMDNCTPEQAQMLEKAGYSQIVLARELSIPQIESIHAATTLPLEAFVHGALCVSYSGRCYASEYCFSRSANRGCCAQFCRLAFDLVDANGCAIVEDQHLLSLRDMNRSQHLEEMMDAGVSSFKIEGRLKDIAYVKNVTAYYRQAIDAVIIRRNKDYQRSSFGTTKISFTPQLEKSFNRGYTDYFLHGRSKMMWNFYTPKSMGECVGTVSRTSRKSFTLRGDVAIYNGDGLVFINPSGKLEGLRANRVEGSEIFPFKMPVIKVGTTVYRNEDRIWETELEKPTANRTLPIHITLKEADGGYELLATLPLSEDANANVCAHIYYATEIQTAAKPQNDYIIKNLSKVGGTAFSVAGVDICTLEPRFIPASMVSEMRRQLLDEMTRVLLTRHHELRDTRRVSTDFSLQGRDFSYTANVANTIARNYLKEHGAGVIAPAFELQQPVASSTVVLMTCRHCLRYAFGQCPRETGRRPTWKEPLRLRLADGRKFPLRFDCVRCEMQVLSPKS